MDRARRLGLNGRIAFPGFRQDFYQILSNMDVFVLPSLTEGLSNVILEAFAASKPVVATAVGGNPELVRHMETGLLVPPCNPDALSASIEFMLSNPEKAQQMAHAGGRLLQNEFSLVQFSPLYCSSLHNRALLVVNQFGADRLSGSSWSILAISAKSTR